MNIQEDKKPYPISNSVLVLLNFLIGFAALFCISSFWTWAKNVFPIYSIPKANPLDLPEYKIMHTTWVLTSYLALIGILVSIVCFFFFFKFINEKFVKNDK